MPRESFDLTDHVVETIYQQSTGPQPEKVHWSTLRTVMVSHGRWTIEDIDDALGEAIADGRLDTDGDHYWLTE